MFRVSGIICFCECLLLNCIHISTIYSFTCDVLLWFVLLLWCLSLLLILHCGRILLVCISSPCPCCMYLIAHLGRLVSNRAHERARVRQVDSPTVDSPTVDSPTDCTCHFMILQLFITSLFTCAMNNAEMIFSFTRPDCSLP